MTLDILFYRLYRLRRTIVLGLLPTLATIWVVNIYTGQTFPILTTLALLVPVAHAVRYPNCWTETLTASLVLSVCLLLPRRSRPAWIPERSSCGSSGYAS